MYDIIRIMINLRKIPRFQNLFIFISIYNEWIVKRVYIAKLQLNGNFCHKLLVKRIEYKSLCKLKPKVLMELALKSVVFKLKLWVDILRC